MIKRNTAMPTMSTMIIGITTITAITPGLILEDDSTGPLHVSPSVLLQAIIIMINN